MSEQLGKADSEHGTVEFNAASRRCLEEGMLPLQEKFLGSFFKMVYFGPAAFVRYQNVGRLLQTAACRKSRFEERCVVERCASKSCFNSVAVGGKSTQIAVEFLSIS